MSPIPDPRFSGSRRASVMEATRAAAEADAARRQRYAIIMTIVALLCFPVIAVIKADQTSVLFFTLLLFVMLAVRVVLGVIAAYILAATVVGGMGYLGEAVVKLIGVYAVTTVTGQLMSFVAPDLLAMLANFGIFVILIHWIFDLDGVEAWLFAIITAVLNIAVTLLFIVVLVSA